MGLHAKTTTLPCPECGCMFNEVTDSRSREWQGSVTVRRRRRCTDCGHAFGTRELLDADASRLPPKIIAVGASR